MEGNLYIPLINTVSANYDYKGTEEEYKAFKEIEVKRAIRSP